MSSKHVNRLEYTEDNIELVLNTVKEAKENGDLSYESLEVEIRAKIDNAKKVTAKNWYNIVKNTEKKYSSGPLKLRENVFNAVAEILDEKGLLSGSAYRNRVIQTPDHVHYALSDFFGLPSNDIAIQHELSGYYLMYRPSKNFSDEQNENEKTLVTLVRLHTKTTGAILAKELIRHKKEDGSPLKRQSISGYILKKDDSNILWMAHDSDSGFARTFMLRVIGRDNKKRILNLSGTSQASDSTSKFTFPVYMERIDAITLSQFKQIMKDQLGLCASAKIPASARKHLKPSMIHHVTFY